MTTAAQAFRVPVDHLSVVATSMYDNLDNGVLYGIPHDAVQVSLDEPHCVFIDCDALFMEEQEPHWSSHYGIKRRPNGPELILPIGHFRFRLSGFTTEQLTRNRAIAVASIVRRTTQANQAGLITIGNTLAAGRYTPEVGHDLATTLPGTAFAIARSAMLVSKDTWQVFIPPWTQPISRRIANPFTYVVGERDAEGKYRITLPTATSKLPISQFSLEELIHLQCIPVSDVIFWMR